MGEFFGVVTKYSLIWDLTLSHSTATLFSSMVMPYPDLRGTQHKTMAIGNGHVISRRPTVSEKRESFL